MNVKTLCFFSNTPQSSESIEQLVAGVQVVQVRHRVDFISLELAATLLLWPFWSYP